MLSPLWIRGCPPRPPPFSFSFPLSLDKAPLSNFRKNARPLPVLSAPGSQLVREGRGGTQWARTTQPARPSVGPAGLPGRRAHAQMAGGTASPGSWCSLPVSSFPADNCKRAVLLLCRPIHLHHVNLTSRDFGQCLRCHMAPFRSLIYLDGSSRDPLAATLLLPCRNARADSHSTSRKRLESFHTSP